MLKFCMKKIMIKGLFMNMNQQKKSTENTQSPTHTEHNNDHQAPIKLDYLEQLDHSVLLDSDDYKIIKDNISHYLCPHEFEVNQYIPVQTILNGFEFGNSALLDLRYNAPVSICIENMQYYLFRITLEGQCSVESNQQEIRQVPGLMSISSPFSQNKITTDGKCRNIILKISRQDLEQKLQLLIGRTVHEPLIFDAGSGCSPDAIQVFIQTLNYLCQSYYTLQNWQYLTDSFNDYLIKLILLNLPHNFSQALNSAHQQLLPSYIKKAQKYIDSNLDQVLSLQEISAKVGVAVRTLQLGFKQYLNQSPVAYIKDKRLEKIHFELENSQGNISVTDILMKHGINSLGHFSAQYKKRYGCVPSQTLKNQHNLFA